MLIQDNLHLSRSASDGQGGHEFLYKVNRYGISAKSRPQEELSQIHAHSGRINSYSQKIPQADFQEC